MLVGNLYFYTLKLKCYEEVLNYFIDIQLFVGLTFGTGASPLCFDVER